MLYEVQSFHEKIVLSFAVCEGVELYLPLDQLETILLLLPLYKGPPMSAPNNIITTDDEEYCTLHIFLKRLILLVDN